MLASTHILSLSHELCVNETNRCKSPCTHTHTHYSITGHAHHLWRMRKLNPTKLTMQKKKKGATELSNRMFKQCQWIDGEVRRMEKWDVVSKLNANSFHLCNQMHR